MCADPIQIVPLELTALFPFRVNRNTKNMKPVFIMCSIISLLQQLPCSDSLLCKQFVVESRNSVCQNDSGRINQLLSLLGGACKIPR